MACLSNRMVRYEWILGYSVVVVCVVLFRPHIALVLHLAASIGSFVLGLGLFRSTMVSCVDLGFVRYRRDFGYVRSHVDADGTPCPGARRIGGVSVISCRGFRSQVVTDQLVRSPDHLVPRSFTRREKPSNTIH